MTDRRRSRLATSLAILAAMIGAAMAAPAAAIAQTPTEEVWLSDHSRFDILLWAALVA